MWENRGLLRPTPPRPAPAPHPPERAARRKLGSRVYVRVPYAGEWGNSGLVAWFWFGVQEVSFVPSAGRPCGASGVKKQGFEHKAYFMRH